MAVYSKAEAISKFSGIHVVIVVVDVVDCLFTSLVGRGDEWRKTVIDGNEAVAGGVGV